MKRNPKPPPKHIRIIGRLVELPDDGQKHLVAVTIYGGVVHVYVGGNKQ